MLKTTKIEQTIAKAIAALFLFMGVSRARLGLLWRGGLS